MSKFEMIKLFDSFNMDQVYDEVMLLYPGQKSGSIVIHDVFEDCKKTDLKSYTELNINTNDLVFQYQKGDVVYYAMKGDYPVSEWLLKNGAGLFESVLIKIHW